MTSRNDEVTVDIEVEGGEKAERSFNRAEKGARKFERSARGLIGPLIGAGLLTGLLGGGLLGLALAGGSASNAVLRIQSSIENLVSTAFRSLEGGIDFAVRQFDKLPAGAQVAVLAVGVIVGALLAKAFSAAIGFVAAQIGTYLAPLGPAIVSGITSLLAGISVAVLAAILAIAIGIAAVVFFAWDGFFNDFRATLALDRWLSRLSFTQWVQRVDRELNDWLTNTWAQLWTDATEIGDEAFRTIVGNWRKFFITPFISAWNAFKGFFLGSFTGFFTETIPSIWSTAWAFIVGAFRSVFLQPFRSAWQAVEDFVISGINNIIGFINTLIQ